MQILQRLLYRENNEAVKSFVGTSSFRPAPIAPLPYLIPHPDNIVRKK